MGRDSLDVFSLTCTPPPNQWGFIKMGFFPMASSYPMHLVFDLGKEVGMGRRGNRPLHKPKIGQE